MSLFLNADYEQQLFSNAPIKIESNTITQELEYFLFLLENEEVFSTKIYDDLYRAHIKKMGGEVKTTMDSSSVKCWWGDYAELEHKRYLNSKLTSTSLAIKNKMCHAQTKIINGKTRIKPYYIYKSPYGMSGRGIYLAEQKNKIDKELQRHSLIEEPLLKRKLDVSYLHLDNLANSGIIYQNVVDQHFQYRGTTIGEIHFSQVPEENQKISNDFNKTIEVVKTFMNENNAFAPWSLDGFTYIEDGHQKLYGISEINYRKTMGYIAHKLHQKWFGEGVSQLILFPTKKIEKKIPYILEKDIKVLSPYHNRFITFFLHGQSIDELNEIHNRLAMDFDVNF